MINKEYLSSNGVNTLEELVGKTLYFVYPTQGIVPRKVRKIQYTQSTTTWMFDAGTMCKVSIIGESVFFTEEEAHAYQDKIKKEYTKSQQEHLERQRELQKKVDMKELERLLNKYSNCITIRVDRHISGNIEEGTLSHYREYPDYESIETITKKENGDIELSICVID